MNAHFDIAIVGAGVAGSLIAAKLAAAGRRVIVLERSAFHLPRHGEYLSAAAAALIDETGTLDAAWRTAHMEANEFVSAWGGSPQERNSIFDHRGSSFVLDRIQFDRALALGASRYGAKLVEKAKFRHAQRSPERWMISFEHEGELRSISALFLAICWGRNGPRLPFSAIRRRRLDKQVCVGVRIFGYQGDSRPAVETYPLGWAYSVGLPNQTLMINLFTESEAGARRASKSIDYFIGEIAHCAIAASRLMKVSPRNALDVSTFIVDASSTWVRPAIGPGWCLAGDCAQAMDPLSSSGIAQAAEHARLIAHGLIGRDLSTRTILEEYGRHLELDFAQYRAERSMVYQREGRWDTPFWMRRRTAGHTATFDESYASASAC